jgi:hypothetical protein
LSYGHSFFLVWKFDPPAGAAPAWSALRVRCIAGLCHGGMLGAKAPTKRPRSGLRIAAGAAIKVVLPRGLAPRTSALMPSAPFGRRFAQSVSLCSARRAACRILTLRELKMVRHAGAAPAPAVWKTAVLAVTPMTRMKMVAASGIAPGSPRLQRGANLSQLHSQWSLRGVSRRGLSVIGRLLCF